MNLLHVLSISVGICNPHVTTKCYDRVALVFCGRLCLLLNWFILCTDAELVGMQDLVNNNKVKMGKTG